MSKCTKCYDAEARDTKWERFKAFVAYRFFGEHISDEKASSFTKGFGEGYVRGAQSRQPEMEQLHSRITTLAMHDVGNKTVVDMTKILGQRTDGGVYLGADLITKEHAMRLKEQAHVIANSAMWEVFMNTAKHQAIEMGFVKSKNFEETISGKTMIKNLELLRDLVEVCKNLRVDN